MRVRRNLPPVNRRHVKRLPVALAGTARGVGHRRAHARSRSPSRDARTRRVAVTLIEQGDEVDRVERALASVGFHPSVCREAAQWAWDVLHDDTDDTTPTAAPPLGGR